MLITIIIGSIAIVCVISSVIFYIFVRSRNTHNHTKSEKQHIVNPFRPSMGTVTKTFGQDSPTQSKSLLSQKNSRSSYPTNQYEITELTHKKQHRSAGSIHTTITSARSCTGLVTTYPLHRPRSANWRQGSIVDSKQMALIEFSLPIHKDNSYRRRSVAICNSISEPKENPLITRDSTLPCLLSFSLTYLKNCQLKVLDSFLGVKSNLMASSPPPFLTTFFSRNVSG